jgi:hypothetical protein
MLTGNSGETLHCQTICDPDSHYLTHKVTFPVKTAQSKCVDEIPEMTSESKTVLKQCPRQLAYYPGGECDSAANKGDGSLLWYVNTWPGR